MCFFFFFMPDNVESKKCWSDNIDSGSFYLPEYVSLDQFKYA